MVTAELFASLPQSVGNITFTPDNRVIYSHHPFFAPEIKVAELNPDRKSFKPFPNAAWNTSRPGTDQYLDSVLGLRGDEAGIAMINQDNERRERLLDQIDDVRKREVVPGRNATRSELRELARFASSSFGHPTGTCHAGSARTTWQSLIRSRACTASRTSGSPTPRSCRPCRPPRPALLRT
jgi:hypothetical protein